MGEHTNHFEVEDIEVGSEAFILEGTITYSDTFSENLDDGPEPTGYDVHIEVVGAQRYNDTSEEWVALVGPELQDVLTKHKDVFRLAVLDDAEGKAAEAEEARADR